MNIHEYQAKAILKEYDLPIPESTVAYTAEEAYEKSQLMSSPKLVVKSQVYTGGRGKAGGIKFANSSTEVREIASELIGKTLVTHQTGPSGELVEAVLLEEPSDILHEYYLSFVLDRSKSRIVLMASTEGGMDIEEVAAKTPEKIIKETIDPLVGLTNFQAANVAFSLKIPKYLRNKFIHTIKKLYQVYSDKDCSILEINPFVLTKEDQLAILDAKFNFDENALYRQPEIEALEGKEEAQSAESVAAKSGLSYIALDGTIGCLVNGAGLAMATMDIINYYGGEPANFLDVGGSANEATVKTGFELILKDKKVDGILVNIFGGIMRCDVIARGIVEAAKTTDITVPLVIRLDGTNASEGKKILEESDLPLHAAHSLADGVQQIIALTEKLGD
ncbi:ADP-forming succinate--CoA ligase subunit beta [Bavariicoccus seileri]|uniref:ADP-forming succinate--CoA ligase subunit beta n=1 Tax=Bavariicoccus seileri TaxID=549685 RepID=UPI003F905E36